MRFTTIFMTTCTILLLATNTYAYTIIYDETEFLHQFQNPITTITFDTLKDGTAWPSSPYENVFATTDLLYASYGTILGFFAYNARSEAFSDSWTFRSHINFDGVGWTNGAIHGAYPRNSWSKKSIIISNSEGLIPFSIITDIGFIGIIPDQNENILSLYNTGASTIFEFTTNYTPSPVPEPATFLLMALGLTTFIAATLLKQRNAQVRP